VARAKHHLEAAAKVLSAELRMPWTRGRSILAQNTNQARRVFPQCAVIGQRIRLQQIARLLRQWIEV
jgi:hypothetical protein